MIAGIVPVAPLARSKSRFSKVLDERERRELTLRMLEDVLIALRESFSIERIFLVGSDRELKDLCEIYRAEMIEDFGEGINRALEIADSRLGKEFSASLVLPLDVPLVESEDVDDICSTDAPLCLNPSRRGGTNAVFRRPPDIVPPCYRGLSFHSFIKEGISRGLSIEVFDSFRLSLDIDYPEDLVDLYIHGEGKLSHDFISKLPLEVVEVGDFVIEIRRNEKTTLEESIESLV